MKNYVPFEGASSARNRISPRASVAHTNVTSLSSGAAEFARNLSNGKASLYISFVLCAQFAVMGLGARAKWGGDCAVGYIPLAHSAESWTTIFVRRRLSTWAMTIVHGFSAAWRCVEVVLVGRPVSVVVFAPAVPSVQDGRLRGGKQWS